MNPEVVGLMLHLDALGIQSLHFMLPDGAQANAAELILVGLYGENGLLLFCAAGETPHKVANEWHGKVWVFSTMIEALEILGLIGGNNGKSS